MKKVLCNAFDCENNCRGKCSRKEIMVDKAKGCLLYKPFQPGSGEVPPEFDPPTVRY